MSRTLRTGSFRFLTVPLHSAMTDGLILHPDHKTRCWWPGTDPFYVAYHDTEWGVPEFDDRALFEALMLDTGIVRNRAKIEATIAGARAWLVIQERGGFSRFLWDFIDGRPVQTNAKSRKDVPTENEVSRKISKALKAEGFNFVGPTIVYAFMQAVGMTNDHLTGCYRHAECAALAEAL